MQRVVASFNQELTSYVAYESCRNLSSCFAEMNGCNSGERFNYTERLKRSVRNGGVAAVSHYWSNVVVGVATMLGVVKDTRHFMEGVTLAPTTKTATKLREVYQIGREQKHLDGVVTMVSKKMNVKRPEGENLTCEGVRDKKGIDILREGDLLLEVNENGVSEWSTDMVRGAILLCKLRASTKLMRTIKRTKMSRSSLSGDWEEHVQGEFTLVMLRI